ncbi:hypothetical protein DL93DRAFT_2168838 [Clavulina sp. PMI_390]|nr:hypothetical protein DL93DRAFT_2168838 [Clavulina sp. PMI_390]
MADLPPSYDPSDPPPPALDPPPFSPSSDPLPPPAVVDPYPTKHTFTRPFNSNKDSCTITLYSRAPNATARPTFFPGDVVKGEVRIDVGKASKKWTSRGVGVLVRGFVQQTAFSGMQEHALQTAGMKETFANTPATFLSDPGLASTTALATFEPGSTHASTFELTLPRTIMWGGAAQSKDAASGKDKGKGKGKGKGGDDALDGKFTGAGAAGKEYPLPPSYVGKGLPQSFAHDLEVEIRKKGMFATDEIFVHPLRVVPNVPTPPYPPLRQEVYLAATQPSQPGEPVPRPLELIGPEDDPDGWELFSATVKGRLFDREDVEVYVRLNLANPLIYPLDGYIPFLLTFESSNEQALDLLSSSSPFALSPPTAASQPQAGSAKGAAAGFTVSLAAHTVFGTDVSIAAGHRVNVHREIVARARVWKPQSGPGSEGAEKSAAQYGRTWVGEIKVPAAGLAQNQGITVGFVSPTVTLKYEVDLAVLAPGFVITSPAPPALIMSTYTSAVGPNANALIGGATTAWPNGGGAGTVVQSIPVTLGTQPPAGVKARSMIWWSVGEKK